MQVKVFHTAFEETPVHIATVEAPHAVHEEACEYAYRWTQNIMDSWSKNMPQDGNANVEVVQPLHVDEQGNEWGHRSSAMGDYFEADGHSTSVRQWALNPQKRLSVVNHFRLTSHCFDHIIIV